MRYRCQQLTFKTSLSTAAASVIVVTVVVFRPQQICITDLRTNKCALEFCVIGKNKMKDAWYLGSIYKSISVWIVCKIVT